MTTMNLPRLSSCGIDLDPDHFGFLRESSADEADNALQERLDENGYLYLPGYLDPSDALDARRSLIEPLAEDNVFEPGTNPMDAIARKGVNMSFRPGLGRNNVRLFKLLYTGRMIEIYERLLGGEVRHFDFTWLRVVSPGNSTRPHCDIVYMGRGTTRLYTSWTPLGDVPLEMGGLLILEGSHRHDRLRESYGKKDVDKFCVNRVGEDYTGMGGGGNIASGGVLSPNPTRLRERIGGRWLSSNYDLGDLLILGMYTVHASLDNHSDRIRLSSDTRYQLASDPVDERWIGDNPIAHGPEAKRGFIC